MFCGVRIVCAQPEVADVWGSQSSGDTAGSNAASGAAATPPAPVVVEEEEEDVITVDDLYGPGLRYPAPYDAGRPPHDHVHQVLLHPSPSNAPGAPGPCLCTCMYGPAVFSPPNGHVHVIATTPAAATAVSAT